MPQARNSTVEIRPIAAATGGMACGAGDLSLGAHARLALSGDHSYAHVCLLDGAVLAAGATLTIHAETIYVDAHSRIIADGSALPTGTATGRYAGAGAPSLDPRFPHPGVAGQDGLHSESVDSTPPADSKGGHGGGAVILLADQVVRLLKGQLRLRQVTRLTDNGHQTPILTSRRDLPAAQVAYRMFDRWRQENFFKYLREEYALDALVEYATVPDDPTREVPNPAWTALNVQLRQAYAQLDRLQAEYGLEALTNLEQMRRTMRGFKIAQGKLGGKIWSAVQRVLRLEKRRAAVPRRVPVQTVTEDPVVKLAPERKHLTNLIKMVAYQAESDLLRLVAPHYRRTGDEGRTLIQSALASAADLEVTQTELRVILAAQSSPHRTRAIAALCEELNQTKTVFPGSKLRLHYSIREAS